MGGGKETPRQKMIGMMYLVLTALLAMNVSKQILQGYLAVNESVANSKVNLIENNKRVIQSFEAAINGNPAAKPYFEKAQEAQKQLDAIKHEQALSDAKAELSFVDDEEAKASIALGLLQAGEHRTAIVAQMQALAKKAEDVQKAVAMKLGYMPKGNKPDEEEALKDSMDEKTKALVIQNRKRGLK